MAKSLSDILAKRPVNRKRVDRLKRRMLRRLGRQPYGSPR